MESFGVPPRTVTLGTLLFLSFDRPIQPGPLLIGPSPASLPRWDKITQAHDRHIILWFHDQITNRRLDIAIKQ
jgi:hypothetical protein